MAQIKPMPAKKAMLAAANTLEAVAPYVSVFPSEAQDCLYTAAKGLRKMAEAKR
jgi:hypothetical protein